MGLCPRLLMLDYEGATFLQNITQQHTSTSQRPESSTYIGWYVYAEPTAVIPVKTKTNAALNSSLCTLLANDTTNEPLPQDSSLLGYTQCNIPDDFNLHHQHQQNLKSHITSSLCMNCPVRNSPPQFSDNLLLFPGVGGRGRWMLANAPDGRSTGESL